MAQVHEIRLIDDLTGEEADETVQFALDGKSYEIDLSRENANRLREALANYVASARRLSGRRGARRTTGRTRPVTRRVPTPEPATPRSRRAAGREENQAIREWARSRGMKISDRGRIPTDVLEAYYREH